MDKDVIYRQDAIDALMEIMDRPNHADFLYTDEICKTLNELPSAQPEIIRCKSCKHKHLENAVWTCPFGLPGGPDFYCGYGAERKTDE